MEEQLLNRLGSWVVIIVVMGSLADLLQCAWAVRRWSVKTRKQYKDRLRKEVLLDLATQGKLRTAQEETNPPPGLHEE